MNRGSILNGLFLVGAFLCLSSCCQIMPCSMGLAPSEPLTPEPTEPVEQVEEAPTDPTDEWQKAKETSSKNKKQEIFKQPVPGKLEFSFDWFDPGLNNIDEFGVSTDGESLWVRDVDQNLVRLIRLKDQKTVLWTGGVLSPPGFSRDSSSLVVLRKESSAEATPIYSVTSVQGVSLGKIDAKDRPTIASNDAKFFATNDRLMHVDGRVWVLEAGAEKRLLERPYVLPGGEWVAELVNEFGGYTPSINSYQLDVTSQNHTLVAKYYFLPPDCTVDLHWSRGFYLQIFSEHLKFLWPAANRSVLIPETNVGEWEFVRRELVEEPYLRLEFEPERGSPLEMKKLRYRYFELKAGALVYDVQLPGKILQSDLEKGLFASISMGREFLEVVDRESKSVLNKLPPDGYKWTEYSKVFIDPDQQRVGAGVDDFTAVSSLSAQYRMMSMKDGRLLWKVDDCWKADFTQSILMCAGPGEIRLHSLADGSLIQSYKRGGFLDINLIKPKDQALVALKNGRFVLMSVEPKGEEK